MTELPTYTSLFRLQRRLYAIYDWELPVPVGLLEAGVFIVGVGLFALIGHIAGIELTPGSAWFFVVPPGFMAYAARKPFADGKQPHAWLIAQMRFALEPRLVQNLADAASRRRRAAAGALAATVAADAEVADLDVADLDVADADELGAVEAAPDEAAAVAAPEAETETEAEAEAPVDEAPADEAGLDAAPSPRRRRAKGSEAAPARRRRNGAPSAGSQRRRRAARGGTPDVVGTDPPDGEVAVGPPTRQVGERSDSTTADDADESSLLEPAVVPAVAPARPVSRRAIRREARREARRRRARWAAAGRQVRAAARAARKAADAQAKESTRAGRQEARAARAAAKDAARAARAARKRPPAEVEVVLARVPGDAVGRTAPDIPAPPRRRRKPAMSDDPGGTS